VASVVNTRRSPSSPSTGPAKSRSSTPSAPKTNPVALEVPVIATGARPGDSGGQRELFAEETTTVLVFENGAVIRLSAAVAAGQLLFLTHKESRREVVAQVTRKRDFRPTNCYVEVEFSEPAPGFWGVELSESPQLLPATAQQKEAAELVQGSRIVSGKQSEPTSAPSVDEVERLKQEVDALRKQLRSMQTKTVAENPPKLQGPAVTATSPPVPAVAATTPLENSPKSPTARVQVPAASSSLSSPAARQPPVEREIATSSEEKAFPMAQMRVGRQKPAIERSPKPKPTPRGNLRPEVRRAGLLFLALLAGAVGGAWYLNWIPWLKPPRKPAVQAVSSRPAPAANSVPQKPADMHPDPAKPLQPAGGVTSQLAAASTAASQPASVEGAKPSALAELESSVLNEHTVGAPSLAQKSAIAPAAARRIVPGSSDKTESVSSQPASAGGPVLPPKLIKSVRAVASPHALQYFDKSNTVTVTLDALVDASGAVKSMKVVAGPASLRRAAMKALKQYRYAPAVQNGKRVAAHVTVAIKFLFEP
jgi:Gram-negative bacterial TonB protein C-terminal